MVRLLRSFFYKLFRDMTFRIIAIVGVVLAVILTLINCFLMKELGSGAYCLITSISPSQNYGIAIPVNLAIFLTLLFTQGIIRNQIIVGNSKTKVYFSLLIGGVVFTLSLVLLYVGLCTALGSIFKGFYAGAITSNIISGECVAKIIFITIINYILIATFATCIASLFKNTGVAIPLTIVPIIMFSIIAMIMVLLNAENSSGTKIVPQEVIEASKYLNPQHLMGSISGLSSLVMSSGKLTISNQDFFIGIANNIVYILIFGGLGLFAFNKMDLK